MSCFSGVWKHGSVTVGFAVTSSGGFWNLKAFSSQVKAKKDSVVKANQFDFKEPGY